MAGTSAGAAKGWITRRRGGLSMTNEGVIMPRPRGQAARATPPQRTQLQPIARIDDLRIDPHAPPDPQQMLRLYGQRQLRAALEDYSLDALKGSARMTQQRHPGTAPRQWNNKRDLLDYLERYGGAAPRATPAPRPAPAPKSSTPVRGQRVQPDIFARALPLRPVRHIQGREINPAQTVDPYFLRAIYGDQQLEQALSLWPASSLREAARDAGVPPGRTTSETAQRLAAIAKRAPINNVVAFYERHPNSTYRT